MARYPMPISTALRMYSSGRMNGAGMGRGGLAPLGHLIPTAMVYGVNLNCQTQARLGLGFRVGGEGHPILTPRGIELELSQ